MSVSRQPICRQKAFTIADPPEVEPPIWISTLLEATLSESRIIRLYELQTEPPTGFCRLWASEAIRIPSFSVLAAVNRAPAL